MLFSNAASATTYYLENNATVRSVGADGNTNYNTSSTVISVIPYKNLWKNGTMGTAANIRYTISSSQVGVPVEIFRFYLPFNYSTNTRISANVNYRITWRTLSSQTDIVNVSLIVYDPVTGAKTVIGGAQNTTNGAVNSYDPYYNTMNNPDYIVPAGSRLMVRINTTATVAELKRLQFNDNINSYINITEFPLGGATYNLSGYISNKLNGAPINGATVQTNTSLSTTTNDTGYYNFTLTNGTYLINASLTGYVTNSTIRTISGADVIDHNISLSLIPTYIPPTPASLTSTKNNFWVNYTWQAGPPGNITNSYNVSHNGSSWTNNTIKFRNNTVGPHGWSNITVYAYNNSGTGQLSLTPATMETQVNNNVPVLAPIGNKVVTAGQILTITISATDADSDPLTNATNATEGSFTSSNVYTWITTGSDVGTHQLEFNTSDNYGGIDSETITVTVNAATYIPPTPTITDIFQGNFWINYTWLPGSYPITDSYNVSVNSIWTNGTTQTFNLSTVGAHGWSNISVYAFNNSGTGSLNTTPAALNTQLTNNAPVQAPIGNKAVTAGILLTFTVSASDADSDLITYSTNATKGALNSTSGLFSWMPASADNGTYFWLFSSSDGWGGMVGEPITVNVADTSGTYINGTVRSGGIAVGGVTVSTNTSINTTTDAFGFYSLPVTAGTYQLTAAREPVYYTNSSVTAALVSGVVVQDIGLVIKPTGTITGSVLNA